MSVVIKQNEWTKFDDSFKRIGSNYSVDWRWLKAHALVESDLGRDSRTASGDTSSDGLSWGLMQVTLRTALAYDSTATKEKLAQLEPSADYSIGLAARLIADNKKAFDEYDPDYIQKVVKSYNQGVRNTKNEWMGLYTKFNDPQGDNPVQAYWERWQRKLSEV